MNLGSSARNVVKESKEEETESHSTGIKVKRKTIRRLAQPKEEKAERITTFSEASKRVLGRFIQDVFQLLKEKKNKS